ncbi:hypothetical protein EDF24_1981 [Curtobacterium sp. PhB130]|uniref:glycosyltransferase family protein n=1 Tax=Curtobacterium sp. PhB130 TaxID=2485178 RepID=UPI000F4B96D0|nr:glycosyltransferase [Curtobacterium sp. PhB130]ROS76392.1 hypothetical protein EDF24_1981 [Curtobacterium sp. PhB130]
MPAPLSPTGTETPGTEAVHPDDRGAGLYRALAAGDRRVGPRGTVAFAVSTADVDSGAGDVYVALGLGKYLERLGWGVQLWPMEQWDTPVPEDVTVLVSMVESFVPGLVPEHTALVAWVRNWTDTWADLPYLDEFDAVWASSTRAVERMAAKHRRRVSLMPIGVDLELFDGTQPQNGTQHQPQDTHQGTHPIDVVTTVNFWGAERLGTAAIDVLAESRDVVWYGANREHLVRSERIDHRGIASFFDLPAVYASSAFVVDDLIPPARKYATHNSRLFEGLASGALVVTNCADGLADLGLEDVPTYHDGPSLVDAVGERDDELVARLRAVVVERHSYAARAAVADAALTEIVAERAGRPGAHRGAFLTWTTHLREQLRRTERERDTHLSGVHDINGRLITAIDDAQRAAAASDATIRALSEERDRLARRLDEVTRSRTFRLAERIARITGRR